MSEGYTPERYIEDLRQIAASSQSEDEIFSRLGPLARRLVSNRDWLKEEHYATDPEQGFGVHLIHEEPDHSLAVFCVAWLPGCGTPPHDHGTWAVVAGIEGDERNVRYRRVDDRSRHDYAELEVKHELVSGPGDLVCMKNGGIHMVRNETDAVTLSLHTYGRHVNFTSRSQYNLETREKTDFKVKIE